MSYLNEILTVQTHQRNEMIDITAEITAAVSKTDIEAGIAIVFCPHTTAGITINENADPDVPHDILLTLDELLPQLRKGYRHSEDRKEGNGKNVADHAGFLPENLPAGHRGQAEQVQSLTGLFSDE